MAMFPTPTRPGAMVAGAVSRFAFAVFDLWAPYRGLNERAITVVYLAAMMLLWLAPVLLFVGGIDPKR